MSTNTIPPNDIADPALAEEGAKFQSWAARSMPVLGEIRERFAVERPLAGKRIAACLHITAETANLVLTLQAGGAEVFLCASNPISTQDRITALLADEGAHVYAVHGEDRDTYYRHCVNALSSSPHIVIDDGGDLTRLLHAECAEYRDDVIAGLEETTTGVHRIRSLHESGGLRYAILAINNAKTKHMFDNRYGTGQSTMDAIMRATNTLLAGKRMVVAGFGMCGRGVAMRARGLGAEVIVTEVDPVNALEAVMEGYRVMPMAEAALIGEIFVTVTGNRNVISREHFERMRDGAMVCNAGHFDVELDLEALRDVAQHYARLRNEIEEYTLATARRIIVLGEGRLVNLVAAEGHPPLVMDMSFANQALGCEYLTQNASSLECAILEVPEALDREVARLKLQTLGVHIDALTPQQEHYMESWDIGT